MSRLNPALPTAVPRYGNAMASMALSFLLLVGVCAFGCWLIGTRSIDTGTDTSTYAGFFARLGQDAITTRLEPGFVAISYALNRLGLGVTGYQAALFALMLATVLVSTRKYFTYLASPRSYLTFLSAALMLLYVSPMFVNASINAVRQGLAALLVFVALLTFQQRKWWQFALFGAIACSLHSSSALYLLFAPALLLGVNTLRVAAAVAFLMYCSGLSMSLVQALLPSLYQLVMEYTANPNYRSGVRIDFAVFSIFWYVLPHLAAPLVHSPYREEIKRSTSVYLVMLLPFFAIGWGYFSNRYLLPGWLAVSLILAAMLCHSRLATLRNPLLIRLGLVGSCGVFYFLVTRGIVI